MHLYLEGLSWFQNLSGVSVLSILKVNPSNLLPLNLFDTKSERTYRARLRQLSLCRLAVLSVMRDHVVVIFPQLL
jgi:hypothetical protein